MRSFHWPILPIEVLAIGGIHIDIGIFGVVTSRRSKPKIVQRPLVIEVTLIGCAVVHIGLYDMKLAHVTPAGTMSTNTNFWVVMTEVGIE